MKKSLMTDTVLSRDGGYRIPDYDLIRKRIRDPHSRFYYPGLMSKFLDLDTPLTKNEYFYLYYGHVHDADYDPYRVPDHGAEIEEFCRGLQDERYDGLDENAFDLASRSIRAFPFDLRLLDMLFYAYSLKGDALMQKNIRTRYEGITDTIMSSGDGRSMKTAFHVILLSHEYAILDLLHLRFKSQMIIGTCDCLEVERNGLGMDVAYFDVSTFFKWKREHATQEGGARCC